MSASSICFLAIAAMAALAGGRLPGQDDRPDLGARIDALCAELDARRKQLHIPGMAIAIVRGDEVVLARGFGWRDVDRQEPVTERTVFAIGSTTKTFTATLLGMLAEEGVIDFEQPVAAQLPGFTLTDPRAAEEITLTDLLSHRSGLSRMPMVWCAGEVDRDTALQRVQAATLLRRFRVEFNYSNVNYLVAGAVAEQAAGTTWETLLTERLLQPLGMATASPSIEALRDPARAARGYRWNERDRKFDVQPLFDLRSIAPAGAINASVLDMSRYLQMLIAGGLSGDVRLVESDTLEDQWEQQALIGPRRSYGLGWMVDHWDDRRVVGHGGNIDGFSSVFAFMPEERLGFSLLMNVMISPLQAEAPALVWEALLGDLTPLPRIPEAELAAYTGLFRNDDVRVRTSIRNGRLHAEIDDGYRQELAWPDPDGHWHRGVNPFSVVFRRDEDGEVDALELHRSRTQTLQRIESPENPPATPFAPEVRELLHRMRTAIVADAIGDLGPCRLEGTVTMTHQGLEGRAQLLVDGPERYAERWDFGAFGYRDKGFDGTTAWADSSTKAFRALEESKHELTALSHAIFFVDWQSLFSHVELKRRRTVRGRPTQVLQVTPRELPPFTVYVDDESATIVRVRFHVPVAQAAANMPLTVALSDYRQVGSIRLPFRREFETPLLGDEIVQFERVEQGVEVTSDQLRPRKAKASGR